MDELVTDELGFNRNGKAVPLPKRQPNDLGQIFMEVRQESL